MIDFSSSAIRLKITQNIIHLFSPLFINFVMAMHYLKGDILWCSRPPVLIHSVLDVSDGHPPHRRLQGALTEHALGNNASRSQIEQSLA